MNDDHCESGRHAREAEDDLTELSERVGITQANLSILKNGRARAVRFDTLDKICRVLGCQPGDILEYRADDEKAE